MLKSKIAAIVCTATLLVSCSGGSSTMPSGGSASIDATASPSKNGSSVLRHHKATLKLHIRIPRRHRRHRKGARFVSAATKGMTVQFSGPTNLTETVGLTPGTDSRCTGPAGGPYSCTIGIQLLSGSYTGSISTYDNVSCAGYSCTIPGGANLLSTASSVPFTITPYIVNNIDFTLSGVVASLQVSGVPTGTAGTAFGSPQSFTVTAKDADGYTIVGAYENAVAISDNDTSGAATVTTSGSDAPPGGELLSSNDTVTLNYTGLAINPATITASATGATNGTGTFTPTLQPIVITTSDTLNPSYVGVDLYATSGAGSTASFSASEAGWTNAPYNNTLSASTASGCSSIATLATSGTSVTATVASSPAAGKCTATIKDPFGQSQAVTLAYTNFPYPAPTPTPICIPPPPPSFSPCPPMPTPAPYSIAVPNGVTQVTIVAAGAQGGAGDNAGTGGNGGSVTATVGVSASATLEVFAGGMGSSFTAGGIGFGPSPGGGWNGGGGGGGPFSAGGGGASDVRASPYALADRLVVAGGGGGSSSAATSTAGKGGAGGNATGVNGLGGSGAVGGGGATGSMGGTAGTGCVAGIAGSLGLGGAGGGLIAGCGIGGNGGGSGYYGGGGGGSGSGVPAAGGGGGSSFAEASASNVTMNQGTQTGNGLVVIIW